MLQLKQTHVMILHLKAHACMLLLQAAAPATFIKLA
jgi:hypothetical protein